MWSLPLTITTRSSLISYDFFRYVVNAAKVAKADKDQRLIYVSVRSSFEPVGFTAHMS